MHLKIFHLLFKLSQSNNFSMFPQIDLLTASCSCHNFYSFFFGLWGFRAQPAVLSSLVDLTALLTMHFSPYNSLLNDSYCYAVSCNIFFCSSIRKPAKVIFCLQQKSQLAPFSFTFFFFTAASKKALYFHVLHQSLLALSVSEAPYHPSCRKWFPRL